jgi:hypothetical protein
MNFSVRCVARRSVGRDGLYLSGHTFARVSTESDEKYLIVHCVASGSTGKDDEYLSVHFVAKVSTVRDEKYLSVRCVATFPRTRKFKNH